MTNTTNTTNTLTGSTALVTGATAGIGRAIALQLAALGAEVVVHGRSAERGAKLVQEIENAGGKARFISVDLGEMKRQLTQIRPQIELAIRNKSAAELDQEMQEIKSRVANAMKNKSNSELDEEVQEMKRKLQIQKEEMKHFCMDLEYLLRKRPEWRTIAQGILLTKGDIISLAEKAEEKAD